MRRLTYERRIQLLALAAGVVLVLAGIIAQASFWIAIRHQALSPAS